MTNGNYAGQILKKQRLKARWKDHEYNRRMLGLNVKADPLGGSPQGRGIRDWSVTGVQTCALPI